MKFSQIVLLVFSLHIGFWVLDAKPISAQKPVFDAVVDGRDSNNSVKVLAEIEGATDLYLIANDAGNGNSFDWADWIRPRLVADGRELSLLDLQWSIASSDYGEVKKNANCFGGGLEVASTFGKPVSYKNGIGVHANSVIHFKLPANHGFKELRALAGLDCGGVQQKNGRSAKVRFMVFTERPPGKFTGGALTISDHDAFASVEQFDVNPELAVSVFAHEPMLVNPTNIDVDHLGRVWVCEVVNYRNKIRNGDSPQRAEGDRILILIDENQDGVADQSKVFYQGPDIDSAHGICVLGDRVIVSAGSEVFYLIDKDGDDRADEKQVLFTGISGVQHDHGIHAFVFGPDGKLYFNFGNEGRQICDAAGEPIVDLAGNLVNDARKPYQQGMVFRCNLDGSEFETLAWNFRYNWELCVDSFGGMWQSDNDDDGNRSTRINYVLPFGNYGYRDEVTGAGWRAERSGKSDKVSDQHWHQNDPGVIPNLLITGAGSSTGICFYEGELLPQPFRNQVIHCDAGPNIVRSYVVQAQKDQAGFEVDVVNIMDGARQNQWFRPSDVCVAPDGSLMVADWYDPGVGGHRMRDIQRGRIFRVTPKNHTGYRYSKPDFSSVAGSIRALKSPNLATRFLGFQALLKLGKTALPQLEQFAASGPLRFRARAYWVMTAIEKRQQLPANAMVDAWNSGESDLRMMALRWSRQETELLRFERFADVVDVAEIGSPAVLRELAVCLCQRRKWERFERMKLWLQIGERMKAGDRWMLEALGIGADEMWAKCIHKLKSADNEWNSPVNRELLWRSRGESTALNLVSVIGKESDVSRIASWFRSMDFLAPSSKESILRMLTFQTGDPDERLRTIAYESIIRRDWSEESVLKKNAILDQFKETPEFVELIGRFRLSDRLSELLPYVCGDNKQLAVDSLKLLQSHKRTDLIKNWLKSVEDLKLAELAGSVVLAKIPVADQYLADFVVSNGNSIERRKNVIQCMSRSVSGCRHLADIAMKNTYDKRLTAVLSAALHSATDPESRRLAQTNFPLKTSKNAKQPPTISKLVSLTGNANNGKTVFANRGTCAKCHVVNGEWAEVGPDLSEIGSKLTRSAMYEAILFPSAGISHNYENWLVLTIDGEVFSGIKISQTDSEVQIRDAENVLHKIAVEDIDEIKQQDLSLMPSDLHQSMTEQELVDLVEYLISLKK